MALFGSKKAAPKAEKKAKVVAQKTSARDLSWVLVKPRITEKAAVLSDKNIYVFDIDRSATKTDVKDAVKLFYKVTPKRVTIVNRTPRTTKNQRTNRWTTVPGAKKAHVTLQKGDTINIV
jgi:large subunit ribosomal protein L23